MIGVLITTFEICAFLPASRSTISNFKGTMMGIMEKIRRWLFDSEQRVFTSFLPFNEAAAEECRARLADPSYTCYDPRHAALALEALRLSDEMKEIWPTLKLDTREDRNKVINEFAAIRLRMYDQDSVCCSLLQKKIHSDESITEENQGGKGQR